jgi:hypothetical protein
MDWTKRIVALLVIAAIVCLSLNTTQAQRRGRRGSSSSPVKRTTAKPTPRATTATPVDSLLTGLYRLDPQSSDDPQEAAERATEFQAFRIEQSDMERLTRRLTSPQQLAIERRGNLISIASTRSPKITFEADGLERVERSPRSGEQVRTRAVLYGDELMVSYTGGSRDDEFSVTLDPLEGGRRLRVTRRIYDKRLERPVIVQSFYDKVSSVARWNIYGTADPTQVATRNRSSVSPSPNKDANRTVAPSVTASERVPEPATAQPRAEVYDDRFIIAHNTQLVATLNNDLSTAQTREGDRFTMTVSEPDIFEGATLEGYVSHINRGGRISGRSEMTLAFERIRLRDGRTTDFNGYVEGVRPVGGEQVRVDNEGGGNVQERDNQTERTAQRTAIGAAVGAIIGAIADGGKGAAIGAAIGAAAGAGSIYAQGRDDLELRSGTQVTVRAQQR